MRHKSSSEYDTIPLHTVDSLCILEYICFSLFKLTNNIFADSSCLLFHILYCLMTLNYDQLWWPISDILCYITEWWHINEFSD